MTKRPDFFLAGAPKCGTTSLYDYLGQHPRIYLPPIKEPHYFGDELGSMRAVGTEHGYLKLFARSGDRMAGEGSTNYLFYRSAAEQIKRFTPDARVIILLRHPVDFIHSYHNQQLFNLTEDIEDLKTALEAEPQRANGRGVPHRCRNVDRLRYKHLARFSQFVQVYFEVFGRERVKVLLLDDLKADPAAAYGDVLRFLGVEDSFTPEFRVINASQQPRSRWLHIVINHPKLRAAGKSVFPDILCARLGRWAFHANGRPVPRPPMDAALRETLQAEFAPEIRRLEALLGRDLSSWRRPSYEITAMKAG